MCCPQNQGKSDARHEGDCMTTTVAADTQAQEALTRLDALLDLGNDKMKLADSDEGPGLSADYIELMEGEYR